MSSSVATLVSVLKESRVACRNDDWIGADEADDVRIEPSIPGSVVRVEFLATSIVVDEDSNQ